ncbi:MAG: 2-amino-4-hydroxy-6-hydroxymethyldihydropteridine diphosphokinase [Firmicutes bacterium]|nr:2-amino-4-hydroxy-6-hydroxymethyldihydropteridine diphosphokinase [Bacillota bacterium]
MARVYLGLGSNLGNPGKNLIKAVKKLEESVKIFKVSSLYKTEPVGVKEQPWFLNCVIMGETGLKPDELFLKIKDIEREIGRTDTRRWGPRVIDIDILFYDKITYDRNNLKIPHPSLRERAFVLIPLIEIDSALVYPGGRLLKEYMADIEDSQVILFEKDWLRRES